MKFYPTFGIEARWGDNALNPPDIEARIIEMTNELSNLAPAKSHWRLVDGSDLKAIPLAEVTADIGGFLKRNIRTTGGGDPDPDEGYLLVLIGSEDDSDTVAGNDLHVMAVVGSKWVNFLRFQVGDIRRPNDFNLITYPFYKTALELLASVWACPWALAFTLDGSSPRQQRQAPFDGAWIAYLSEPLARGLSRRAEVASERSPGGGIVLSAASAVPDSNSGDDLRRSRALASMMLERVGADGPRTGSSTLWPARVGPF